MLTNQHRLLTEMRPITRNFGKFTSPANTFFASQPVYSAFARAQAAGTKELLTPLNPLGKNSCSPRT